jgi:CubicO group peptidase (beta-lactamase class C family)
MDIRATPYQALSDSLLAANSVVGASVAATCNGKMEFISAGLISIEKGESVTPQTIFDVASLSKPVVAYAALQLADAGALDLDAPVCSYARRIVRDDPVSALITARHLLTHTCGLQNVRAKDEPPRVHFPPGTRFSYSSTGFAYLQLAMEARAGEPLEAIMRRLVFEPLSMTLSSFEWQERFRGNFASPHEDAKRLDKHIPPAASASYSLQTTAADYAAFVSAVLKGERLKESTHRQWLTAAVSVPKDVAVDLGDTPADTRPDVGWGLGWGVEPDLGTFFQWGKMDGIRAFVMGSMAEQTGVVLLTNSNTGLRLMKEVTRDVLPGHHPAIEWLLGCVTE